MNKGSEAKQQGHHAQMVFDLGHTPSLSQADFMVTGQNSLAFDHILAFPAWSHPLTLLSGPGKSGKSHLARIWVERSGAHPIELHEVEHFARAGGQSPLLIEDIDRRPYAEDELFHLLNQSMRDQRALLMTARLPVAEWPYKTNDLLSRARLAARFELQAPDDTLLSQMFAKLFADRQVTVDARIVAYLVARMERSAEEVAALVGLMDELALTRRSPITRKVAAQALELRNAARRAADGDDDE